MTLADARSRAISMARVYEGRAKAMPDSLDARQWKVDAQMLRLILDASEAGPTTYDQPTGGGDREIICDGCGEAVPDAHTWAECCAGQRKRIESLIGALAQMEHERDEAREYIRKLEADRVELRSAAANLANLVDFLRNGSEIAKQQFTDEPMRSVERVFEILDAQSVGSRQTELEKETVQLRDLLKERTRERDEAYAVIDNIAGIDVRVMVLRDARRTKMLAELLKAVDKFADAVAAKNAAGTPLQRQECEYDLGWAKDRIATAAQRIAWHERNDRAPDARPTKPETPTALETATLAATVVGGSSGEGDV
jgi:hypothetical protein